MLAALKSNNRICTSAQCKKGSNTEKSNQTSFNWIHIWIECISVERGIENIPTHADWLENLRDWYGINRETQTRDSLKVSAYVWSFSVSSFKSGNCSSALWSLRRMEGPNRRRNRLPKRLVLWVKIISIGMPWIALICGQYAFLSFLVSSRVCSCYVPFEGSKRPTSWGQTWLNCSQDGSGSLSNDALFSWGTWSKNRSNPPKSPQTEGLLLNAQKSYMAIQHYLYRFPFFTTERIQKCC
jgi:hypothetical protein